MTNKILFVDDEINLLKGVSRRLGMEFDLATALSGEEALAVMEQEGPFAVVVTDMRMPHMNGVQFVAQARQQWPDTVYMMLTGNQDQATASAAVNEGHVFRFLNKPCQGDDLRLAVLAGLRQHELITCEKEILHKTFCGAVGVLTDVLEISHPEIHSRSTEIQRYVDNLRKAMGFEDRWEYKLAAKLSLLGFSLMPEADRACFDEGDQSDIQVTNLLRRAATTGRKIIERIPRLDAVAAMIGRQVEVDGRLLTPYPTEPQQVIDAGATMLRVALHADCLERQGISAKAGIAEIRKQLPKLADAYADALEEMWRDAQDFCTIEVPVDKLEEGMVLADDVRTADGVILLRKGRRLTWAIIEKFHCHREAIRNLHPIEVIVRKKPKPEVAAASS